MGGGTSLFPGGKKKSDCGSDLWGDGSKDTAGKPVFESPWMCLFISSTRRINHRAVVRTERACPSLLVSSHQPHSSPLSPPCSYGGGSFSFSNLIQAVTRRFSSEEELQAVRSPGPWGHPQPKVGGRLLVLTKCGHRERGLPAVRPPACSEEAGCPLFKWGQSDQKSSPWNSCTGKRGNTMNLRAPITQTEQLSPHF